MSEKQQNKSPPLPWKTKIHLFFASLGSYASRRSNGSVNRFLLHLDFKATSNPNPLKGVKSVDITVDPAQKLWFRLFVPTSVEPDVSIPVIVFFHGGGFVFLGADSKSYDFVCRRFARCVPAVVVSVNYRLAPEHRFPSQYEDGFDVLKFLDKNFSDLLPANADVSRCFLAGDSAGANLAHHVALRVASATEDAAFLQKVRVAGLIAIQPFFGGEERTESEIRLEGAPLVSLTQTDWMWKAFLPDGSNRDHEAVNVTGPNSVDIAGFKNFPKTIVFVGGYDPLQDWQMRYYQWLKRSGNEVYLEEYPNSIHSFYLFPELSESSKLIVQVSDFMKGRRYSQSLRVVSHCTSKI